MQPLQQQQGDQGCPNLDAEGVFAGADEGLDGQVLLEGLEEQLYLPALLVDGGDGGGAELQQVGEQDDLPLVFGIPYHRAAQKAGTVRPSLEASKANDLIGEDVAILREFAFLDHFKRGVVLQAGHEENAGHAPASKQGVIDIAAIDGHNRTGIQAEGVGQFDVAAFGFGEQDIGGQVVVMIQQDVGLDATLSAAEPGPRKQTQAERDGGGVQAEEFVLEAKLVLAGAQGMLPAEAGQYRKEEFLEQRRRAVFVGVGQGGATGRFGDSHMHQASEAAPQAIANLTQRIRASELAEQHGDELGPAGKALGGTLGGVLLDQCGELATGEVLEQLIEQARGLYDWVALLWAAFSEVPARICSPNVKYRRALSLFQTARTCFGQE